MVFEVCINYLSIAPINCLTKGLFIFIMSDENLEKEESDVLP